jgi:hypothetical protein
MDLRLRLTICLVGFLSACDDSNPTTVIYTLYRNSPEFADMRIHVASFDAAADKDYNRHNCEIARDLFASQPGVKVRYWCERGRFQP